MRAGGKTMQRGGNRLVQIGKDPPIQAAELFFRDTWSVEEQFMLYAHHRQPFQLPLIHFNGSRPNQIEKILKASERAHPVSELG